MPNTLAEWLDYLESLHPVGIDMGLDRVSLVAERMGLLDRPIAKRTITVAGTNGKGSTLAMIDALARGHGLRTGTYTSPHLLRYNERVTVDGREASDKRLVEGFQQVEAARLQAPALLYVPGREDSPGWPTPKTPPPLQFVLRAAEARLRRDQDKFGRSF